MVVDQVKRKRRRSKGSVDVRRRTTVDHPFSLANRMDRIVSEHGPVWSSSPRTKQTVVPADFGFERNALRFPVCFNKERTSFVYSNDLLTKTLFVILTFLVCLRFLSPMLKDLLFSGIKRFCPWDRPRPAKTKLIEFLIVYKLIILSRKRISSELKARNANTVDRRFTKYAKLWFHSYVVQSIM